MRLPANAKSIKENEDGGLLLCVLVRAGAGDVPDQAKTVLVGCDFPASEWAAMETRGFALVQPEMVALVSGLATSAKQRADLKQIKKLLVKSHEQHKGKAGAVEYAFLCSGGFQSVHDLI
eukprot:SAG31_NODE_5808_length_2318_cov_1.551600_2_plen_119_part_01